ncbi:16S rRNA (guanine(966)-N(2))-methyltransferase RsmD [Sphingosinicellaceae bacterium]|nr:16S rRNA (guanine(966)-N(2))-methyltransferase RsmD [Sphingosinicellaceae bacterium]
MRIIAGKWRGRAIVAPAGDATRPTADRVREALFSMLTSRLGSFEGLRVADVFAGTGALGLEALSRGAAHASFIESDADAVKVLRTNIAKLGAEAATDVAATSVATVGRSRQPCDLILLDPPYGEGLAAAALARLHEQGWIAPHALISVETGAKEALEVPGYVVEVTRRHGKAAIHLLRPEAPAPAEAPPAVTPP